VLYLRLVSFRETPAIGEENSAGSIELRDEKTGNLIGITVVNWWKRFGNGTLPDSIRGIEGMIEPFSTLLLPATE
jgi:hypothetical protein